jgi:hypothetical protein
MMLPACALDDQEQPVEEDELQSTEQSVISGWTPSTSEEYPPISCDGASLINGIRCTGAFCDNVAAYCVPTNGTRGASRWMSYFSEEGTSWRYCDPGYWVTGLSCSGDYCDNVALQCTSIGNVARRGCYWTGWISEEGGGTLFFGSGYYAVGAQCSGRFCDNMRFYVCQI